MKHRKPKVILLLCMIGCGGILTPVPLGLGAPYLYRGIQSSPAASATVGLGTKICILWFCGARQLKQAIAHHTTMDLLVSILHLEFGKKGKMHIMFTNFAGVA